MIWLYLYIYVLLITSVVTNLAAPLRPNGIIQTVPDVLRLQIYFLTKLNHKVMTKFGSEL